MVTSPARHLSTLRLLFAPGDAVLEVVNSTLANNSASRASAILAYNDNEKARYAFKNVVVVVENDGIAALMVGTSVTPSLVWHCSHPGTVITADVGKSFLSVTFSKCAAGTYTLDPGSSLLPNRSCASCPFGGKCEGSQSDYNGLVALDSFYGVANSSGLVTFVIPLPTSLRSLTLLSHTVSLPPGLLLLQNQLHLQLVQRRSRGSSLRTVPCRLRVHTSLSRFFFEPESG